MCFSATASFVASGGLAAVGVASVRAARPKERIIAIIPLTFAAQQAFEGVQWLALNNGTTCQVAGYGFLAIAYVLWPVAVPGMVYALDRARRPIVRWFVGLGIAVALWNMWYLLTHTLAISAIGGHIVYDLGMLLGEQAAMLYVVAVSGALLVSRVRAFVWGGLIVFAGAVLAAVSAWGAFPSVWCFFAAVASIVVYRYVSRRK